MTKVILLIAGIVVAAAESAQAFPKFDSMESMLAGFPVLYFPERLNSKGPDLDSKETKETHVDKRADEKSVPEVIHLAVGHWVPGLDWSTVCQVSRIQMAAANYLRSNPESAVFMESLDESWTQPDSDEGNDVRQLFPNGLPKSARELSIFQTSGFAISGAVRVLHFLGELKVVHRAITPELSRTIDDQVMAQFENGNTDIFSPELKSLIVDQRDKALEKEVRSFFESPKNRGKKVVLVFGANHNFEEQFRDFKFSRVDVSGR